MRTIDRIVVHTSATPPSMDIGAAEIRDWHVNDRGWNDIGYHYVVRRDGTVENGRPVEVKGAHVRGANTGSIGVCWVGGVDEDGKPEPNYTGEQMNALVGCLVDLARRFNVPTDRIQGHREVIAEVGGAPKACPVLDMGNLRFLIREARGESGPPMRPGEDMTDTAGDKARRVTTQTIGDLIKTGAPIAGGAAAVLTDAHPAVGIALIIAAIVGFGIWQATRDA